MKQNLAKSVGIGCGIGGGRRLRGQANGCFLRRELDGVGDQLVEHLQNAVLVGVDRGQRRFNAEGDVGLRGFVVGHVRGAAQKIDCFNRLAMQRQAPLLHVVEVQNVVDQANEPVAVGDGHVDHLALLLGALLKRARRDEAQRGAQRGERSAQLVAHRGDELVFHLFKAAPFRYILEGDDHAGDAAVVHERVGAVLDRNGVSILTPEDFVAHADGFAAAHGLQDGVGGFGVRCAVGVAVVNDLVHVAACKLPGRVAQRTCAGFVNEGEPALKVDAVDAFADRLENELALAGGAVQRLFGFDTVRSRPCRG